MFRKTNIFHPLIQTFVCVSQAKNFSFSKNFAHILNEPFLLLNKFLTNFSTFKTKFYYDNVNAFLRNVCFLYF